MITLSIISKVQWSFQVRCLDHILRPKYGFQSAERRYSSPLSFIGPDCAISRTILFPRVLRGLSRTAMASTRTDKRLQHVTESFRDAIGFPTPTKGQLWVSDNHFKVSSQWTFADMDMEKSFGYEMFHISSEKELKFICSAPARDLNDQILFSETSSGTRRLRATCREIIVNDKKQQFIEFWQHDKRINGVYDIENEALHGKVLLKGNLQCFEWSADEKKFLFAAERKAPKAESFFNKKPSENGDIGGQYRFKDTWGEQTDGCISPVVVVVELAQMKVSVIEMDDASLGQAVFTPDGSGVVTVAMMEKPYRLGSIFCNNRHQKLFHYDLETKAFTEIGNESKCIFSPRFEPKSQKLIYFQNAVGGPHQMGAELIISDWLNKTQTNVRTLVPIMKKPKVTEFPGLYLPTTLSRCFSPDGKYIFVTSIWHSRRVILRIALSNGEIEELSTDRTFGDWQLLSLHGEYGLVSRSSPSIEPQLVVGDMTRQMDGKDKWIPVTSSKDLTDVHWKIHRLIPPSQPEQYFEAIHVHNNKPHDLIVYPHGGPHASSIAAYMKDVNFFLKCGFGILFINYRGSIGFGEENLRYLPGRIGSVDVADVHQAVDLIKKEATIARLHLFGGSHGGFIAAHMIGQYPNHFASCCIRNPVIDMSIQGPTDIPDWFWYESGCSGDFRFDSLPTDEDLAKLRACSPIAHATKIQTPCLFQLGNGDLRIDKAQGLKLYKHLLARGVKTGCQMYTDNHSLSKAANNGDVFIHAVKWFDDHSRD